MTPSSRCLHPICSGAFLLVAADFIGLWFTPPQVMHFINRSQ